MMTSRCTAAANISAAAIGCVRRPRGTEALSSLAAAAEASLSQKHVIVY